MLQILWLVLAAALWGCTNPFLKRGSKGVSTPKDTVTGKRSVLSILRELLSRLQAILSL